MKRIREYLSRPIPGYEGKRWPSILIGGGLVFILLFFIQSLNPGLMYKYEGHIIPPSLAASGYALVTTVCLVFALYGVPLVCPGWFEHWTAGKSILYSTLIFIFIAISNIAYDICFFSKGRELPENAGFSDLPDIYLRITITAGVLAMTIILIYQKNRDLKENLQQVQELNESFMNRTNQAHPSYPSSPVLLSGNTKDSIELYPEELLFIEADGNYIKIHYFRKGVVKQKLLRATIKHIEDELRAIPSVMRCHRAFIVNTRYIQSVKGNSQGYRLILSHLKEEIPVSRACTKPIKEKLELIN